MIIAATGYYKLVDTVSTRLAGEVIEPTPQRVVLRRGEGRSKETRPYTVGVQLQGEGFVRGAMRYSTLQKAWIDFETYATELSEDGYIDRVPLIPGRKEG